jgi:hypothetical protein
VAADNFYTEFESRLRDYLPSADMLRIRPANNIIFVSFESLNDFIISVMAAASANIRMEITSDFKNKNSIQRGVDSCFIQLELSNQCLDQKLIHFLYEIIQMKINDDSVTADFYATEKEKLSKLEALLKEASS